MRTLLIGGNGFIGSHIVDAFVDKGMDVVVFDRMPELYRSPLPKVEYHYGEFGNRGVLDDLISNNIDNVVLLVSSTLPKTSNDDPIYDIQMNLVETIALLEICVKHKVKKIIFTSSGGTVYGIPEYCPLDEKHPTSPICSYGIVKLAIEKYISLFHYLYGLNYVTLRLSNPYGIRQNPSSIQGAIPVFMNKLLHDESLHIWGDGSIVRDFLDVRDVAQLVYTVTVQNSVGTYNAGSGHGVSINDIINLIASQMDINPNVIYEPPRNFDVPAIILDCNKVKKEFNWSPKIQLAQGISELYDWMRNLEGC